MNKKVYFLVTLILSLFIFIGEVKAAKELTCVYENGIGSYVTMLVQTSDGAVQYMEEISNVEESEWSSKCVYCSDNSSAGCLNLYFNETEFLIDNHRANIISETASFDINDIKNIYLFSCPDRIYETYFDSYGAYEIPDTTFTAQYHLSNPASFGVIYNFPQPVGTGEISSFYVSYLYELNLDKENSRDDFSYEANGGGSAFKDTDVNNCVDLLGPNLIDMINDVMNIVRIVVPILLVILGTLDFAKATFSGSEDNMAKNRKRFINRIIAAIIVFFIPMFVNLLLTLANEVWGYINPTSCIK